MAAASAAVAASKRVDRLTHEERNSLLRQLHRDNAWLLGCIADSSAALEQLHDRLEAEQKVGLPVPALYQGQYLLAALCWQFVSKYTRLAFSCSRFMLQSLCCSCCHAIADTA